MVVVCVCEGVKYDYFYDQREQSSKVGESSKKTEGRPLPAFLPSDLVGFSGLLKFLEACRLTQHFVGNIELPQSLSHLQDSEH